MQVEGRLFGGVTDFELLEEDKQKKCCACSAKRIICAVLSVFFTVVALAGLWLWVSYLTMSVSPCVHPDATLKDREPPNMVREPTTPRHSVFFFFFSSYTKVYSVVYDSGSVLSKSHLLSS